MATSTSPATPLRKWSIDDAHASRLYSPASPALYGVEMLGAAPAPGSSSPNSPYAFDDEHAYAYRYSLFDDYAEAADDDLYTHPHALAPMPVASSSKLLLHQAPKPASLSEPVQNFFDLDHDPESHIDQPYEYSYEYGVGLARRQFAEKRERRRGGVCEWDFALLDSEHGHGHDQNHLDAAVPDWSPLSDLSLASTNTDSPSADHDPTFGPEVIDSTDNPSPIPNTSSPSYALRKARTAIGNTDAEEMARAMIGLGLVRPSYRPLSDIDVNERARESWRELGFGRAQRELGFGSVQQEGEEENAGASGGGNGWMWTTEEAPGLLEGNMSFIDTEGTDVVSHLDLDFDEDENEELDGGEGHGNAYTHTHAPVDTAADTDDDHGHDPPHSSPPPPPPPQSQSHTHSQHLAVPTSTPHSQLTLRGTRASALVDWAALALDAALREDPGRCWAAVCFGDVFPPPSRPAGSDGGSDRMDAGAGLREGMELGVSMGTRGREREMLAFSHALASPELEVREVHSGARAGDRPSEAEAEAEPEPETSARRASEPDLRLEPAAQKTRGRSQRRKQLPPISPAPLAQTHTRTRPRIVTSSTTTAAASPNSDPVPALAPAAPTSTSSPAAQSQARHRGRTRTRERTPVDPVLCATPATTPPSSALALVSVSPAGLGPGGMESGDVPPVPPLPPSASQFLPANPVVQDDEAQPSLAPLLEPAPASSTGVPALRLDTSWSAPGPGSINSIPLPSMGRRVIGSEGDVFSHVSQSPSNHEGNTDADAGAQEIPLPVRNAHDDAIFAALLTPTAPLALSPTRPPAPRYRPLSDPPPYTAAVAGSNAPPLGLARGVSPGPGGSPGVDAEVSA